MHTDRRIQQRSLDTSILGLHPVALVNRIYAARGLREPSQADLSLGLLLPPDCLLNLPEAVSLLLSAIQNGQRIVVVGDFDCDGATGTAVAVRGLTMLGAAHVFFKVPHRVLHGYGLTPALVDELAELKPDLIITVDSGIACLPGVLRAKALGYAVLVTDHHLPGEQLPPADVIVNPNLSEDAFPSKSLAGVGVIFYLLLAVRRALRAAGLPGADADLSSLLDLVAIGTVADMVKLDANNRRLVRAGLSRIRKGHCQPGVKALAQISGVELGTLSETDIGFRLAPKINAAGRLEDMSLGIECLLSESLPAAMDMATSLSSINAERQEIQQQMLDEAELAVSQLFTQPMDAPQMAYVLHQAHWHPGIIGLVASRVKDKLNRPVLAFAPGEPGSDELRGSARSITGFHIRDALAHIDAMHPGLISRFGGHAMAAGLSLPLEALPEFTEALQNTAKQWIGAELLDNLLLTDGGLLPDELSRATAELLGQCGPWGQGFAEPLFDNIFEIRTWQVLKDKHLKLQLALPGQRQSISGIC
ncbi:MAG: single-stranded-DNA-specific exonuclease RecJ, partial [Arenimonas sp.]|nr:single-stranded-DNA-specific exonuclease RecJ [Arenimonas sp.]